MADKKRWLYLAVGTIILLFCGLIYGWSLFAGPFSEIYSTWTVSELSLTFTLSIIFYCLGNFTAGLFSTKFNPQTIIIAAAVLLRLGFLGVSQMNPNDSETSLTSLYLFYGVICGFGVGAAYNGVLGAMNKWFQDKPALASGTMMMGFGLGALILGGIASNMIASDGLFETFKTISIIIFWVLVIGSFFMKVPKADNSTLSNSPELSGKTPAEVIKSSVFWVYMISNTLTNAAGLLIINSAASIALFFGAPAIVGMVVSIFNGVGRLFIGALYDNIGRKKTMFFNNTVLAVGGVLLFLGSKTFAIIFIILGLVCLGTAYGGAPTISSGYMNEMFGSKYYAINFSLTGLALMPASILGPMISSKLIEKAGGAYDTTFITVILISALAYVALHLLNKTIAKKSKF